MKKRIITISREFGSGGRYIGEEISKKLGIEFYDKEIIAKVAEKTGFAKEFIEQKGEYAPLKNIFAYGLVGRDANGKSVDDMLYSVQREIIIEASDKSPCVIVGRNADYLLKDRDEYIAKLNQKQKNLYMKLIKREQLIINIIQSNSGEWLKITLFH